jgi:hypothetical protein
MADRQFTCPIPRTAQMPRTMVDATLKLERAALKWRDLAERRRGQFVELYRSGRWQHYYTDQEFLDEFRKVFVIARRWAKIVPKPEDLQKPAAKSTPPAKQYALPPAA